MFLDERHEISRTENASLLLVGAVFEFRGVRFVDDIDQLGFALFAGFINCEI